jgi:hypothetical protein
MVQFGERGEKAGICQRMAVFRIGFSSGVVIAVEIFQAGSD